MGSVAWMFGPELTFGFGSENGGLDTGVVS
jgi:hypothetical protein